MRHAAFRMDADTRDRWLRHMRIPSIERHHGSLGVAGDQHERCLT
jgi:hypothetical protein